jgi:hypothetical protein
VTWRVWERITNVIWWTLLVGGPLMLAVSMIWVIP